MSKKTRHTKVKWNDGMYVKAYQLARNGMTGTALANALGITFTRFQKWKRLFPYFDEAIKEARKERGNGSKGPGVQFRDFVYKRLPPHLQDVWDKINKCEEEENGLRKIESLLARQGKAALQHLFLYALVDSNFNQSEACRRVNISKKAFGTWCNLDPDFQDLISEIHEAKKDFFESSLVKLVRNGDSPATIFANKTQNRDRGYGDKLTIEGEVQHKHSINFDELDLPLEVRMEILKAIRKQKALTHQPEKEEYGGNLKFVPNLAETEKEPVNVD